MLTLNQAMQTRGHAGRYSGQVSSSRKQGPTKPSSPSFRFAHISTKAEKKAGCTYGDDMKFLSMLSTIACIATDSPSHQDHGHQTLPCSPAGLLHDSGKPSKNWKVWADKVRRQAKAETEKGGLSGKDMRHKARLLKGF